MPSTVIRTFSYAEAPPEVFEEMTRAFSKGSFFNRRVRDRYPAARES